MDHSALLALKYISWFVSFVFTRQLWLRFLEEGSSPLNFSGWAVTFWLVFTAIISAKVHSADSLAWVGDANRRRKFKIESVKAGRKTILRTSIWTMVPLLTLPRLSASCSKSDRSNAIVRTFVYAPSTPLLPRNWAKESETLEGGFGYIISWSASSCLLVNGSCWQTNATGKFTAFQMINSIYGLRHSTFKTVEARCNCFRFLARKKCKEFYSYFWFSKQDNSTILSIIRSKNLKGSSEAGLWSFI